MDLLQSLIQMLVPSAAAEAPLPPMPLRFSGGGVGLTPPQPQADMEPGVSPGGSPVTDELRKLFSPPPPAGGSPPPRTPPPTAPAPQVLRQSQMQQESAGPAGAVTGGDVQRFIRSVATGAGRADPRAPGVSAFAQGAMGATQNSYGEMEREKAQALAERRADTQDRRADNALAMQEGRDKRQEDEYRRKVTRDEKVDAERQVRTRERLARIAKIEDQRLDPKDIGRIGDQVNRHARYLQVEVNNARMTPEQAEQSLEVYKRDTIEKFVKRDPGAKAGPAPGGPAPGTMVKHGDKTYRFKGGDDAPQNWEEVR